ncbi:hypothetical protein GQ55_1G311400 [Panicum hallii var. hallii]|uniref:Glycosyltransferase n=1 Tax=Panicum hallii var. hallii TaxID=1504633 RepID=A0A2T7F9F3_9POAL|nr:hypothetical protein GQ55_1G311400 [Panicum hallii var. hallii]
MGAESAQAQRAIVFVPFPAQGHVTPMLHLARALAGRGGVAATVAVPDFVHRRMGQQDGDAGSRVALVPIPSGVPDDGGDEEPPGFASIAHAMEHHMPAHLEGVLARAGRGAAVACLVVDVMASWAVPVAARCGVPAVGFWPVMFASYRVVAAIPELISKGFISRTGTPLPLSTNGINEAVNKHQQIGDLHILPAKLELNTSDLPWLVGGAASRESRFAFWLRTVDRAKSLTSILVNSFPGEGAGDSDRYDPPPGQHFLHVGPLFGDELLARANSAATMWRADSTCIDWLDRQSPGSVIYVSFGSWVAPIGQDTIAQLALGLKAAGRPFLWVLRNHPSWRAGLPDGFTETVAGRGKIVSWAPQEDVLRHDAVGCYITHCGWNSTLEAIRHGVRMICYPISGDQFVNRAYIVNMWEAGIALVGTDCDCVKDCIGRAMKGGEEGRRLQDNVARMREAIMAGEARSIAKRNLDLFLEGIENDDTKIQQVTKL